MKKPLIIIICLALLLLSGCYNNNGEPRIKLDGFGIGIIPTPFQSPYIDSPDYLFLGMLNFKIVD